eukprot:TRINITY_DN8283_c1_g1_i7.p1 TRINITY_DN8283_c1_g1~~TRINITY_DN8283_c1_g1_i7.p1  ORF type:complete len:858 (+),score=240.34 TRINITY_DN8283_c1_g1_i7:52-2574(+)
MIIVNEGRKGGSKVGKPLTDPDYFSNLSKGFSEALVTGKFCDVKIICQDSHLWAHRVVLSTVSPFLRSLLTEMEKRGDDVITIFLPRIKGYHMKLVLDYIYSGAMYLCGAHMQYVIQVMEVLNLKCGVSVNKMVQSTSEDQDWIEVEHSTVKIKSKFPPNLPEFGRPSSTVCQATVKPSKVAKKESKMRKKMAGRRPSADQKNETKEKPKDSKATEKSSSAPSEIHEEPAELPTNDEEHTTEHHHDDNHLPKDDTEASSLSRPGGGTDVSSDSIDIVQVPAAHSDDDDDGDFEREVDDADHKDDDNNDESSAEKAAASTDQAEHSADIQQPTETSQPAEQDSVAPSADADENIDNDDFVPDDIDDAEINDADFDDDDDSPVFVELDEDFAVDSLSSSQAQQNEGKKHKCALCGRTFRFYENLRVHLTGHLGVKVTLNRCHTCKRNFKNQTELDLHMKAHSYARHLGKYRLAKSAAEAAAKTAAATKDAKIITTVGTKDKKILRKYTKNRRNAGVLTRKRPEKEVEAVEETPSTPKTPLAPTPITSAGGDTPSTPLPVGPTSGQQFSCDICDKSFIVKSLYLRHMKHKHNENSKETSSKEAKVSKKSAGNNSNTPSTPTIPPFKPKPIKLSINTKRHSISSLAPAAPTSTPVNTSMPSPSAASAVASLSARRENPYSRQYSTPTSSRKRELSTTSDSESSPVVPSVKKRRVLDTSRGGGSKNGGKNGSKHGKGASKAAASSTAVAGQSGTSSSAGGGGANSLMCSDCDKVFVAKTILERHQYTAKHGVYGTSSDSGPGSPSIQHVTERQVDCHLCGQVFLRVKDLVKHREKVCTAWLNPGT